MLRNYFKIALRNLKRNPTFSIINFLGLTFGLAITSLIVLYVSNDLSYDKYHKDSDRIYRLYREAHVHGFIMSGADVSSLMGPYLKETYSFVETQTRVSRKTGFKIFYKDNSFKEEMNYADSTFFDIFTLDFKYGDKSTALETPFSLVITEEISNKVFGDINPVGEVIKSDNNISYTISAVIENVPKNSHFQFDILCSFSTKRKLGSPSKDGWGFRYESFKTYIKLKEGVSVETLTAEFPQIIDTYLKDINETKYFFDVQPMEDIYLYHGGGGDLNRIILFSVIGIFVLLIACINYMNLNTAESIRRMKEIGMRKVLGAHRRELVSQLLIESVLFSFISMILALTLAEILLPIFNIILQKELRFNYFSNWPLTLSFVCIALFTGFMAGTYPAFYLSSIKPVNSLKGKFVFGSIHGRIRNILVVFQFAVTIFLLSCTGIIYMQIIHSTNTDLGFNDKNVLIIDISPKDRRSGPDQQKLISLTKSLKAELTKIPEISNISISATFPFGSTMIGTYHFKEIDQDKNIITYKVDAAFTDLLEMEIIDGRGFSELNSTEENNVIINQAMVKMLGFENPLGKTFTDKENQNKYTIIGVVKDFHRASMHQPITSTMLNCTNKFLYYSAIGLKINSEKIESVKMRIDELIEDYDFSYDFESWFISQSIQGEYTKEVNTARMFTNFAIVAIIIACMGLYGLALFMSRQKTKEIGIRKIFGSSVREIIVQLSKKFVLLVLIAAVIAIPVAWYYTDVWLREFVYQVEGRWIVFVLATIIAVIIAFVTIFYQSLRAASGNPVDAIRYE